MAQPIWNTATGSLGTFPAQVPLEIQLSATPVLPAVTLTYALLSGSLPSGLKVTPDGLIYGTPDTVIEFTTVPFVIRVTDDAGNIKDRTFSINLSGSSVPTFTTPPGVILETLDSLWIELPIAYSNPKSDNPVSISVSSGLLPPGLEINNYGLIRGYPAPPGVEYALPPIFTTATSSDSTNNSITCLTTIGFTSGRMLYFTGTTFGSVIENKVYYIKEVLSNTTFSITETQGGPTAYLTTATGFMAVNIPRSTSGQPTVRTYTFSLKINSPLGSNEQTYAINVINQNASTLQGGPGNPPNTRYPVVLNTQPLTYNLNDLDPYYGYYLIPPEDEGMTYPNTTPANLGTFKSGNYFSFKVIGHNFDYQQIRYNFVGLPAGLTGDINTGWIIGYPELATTGVANYVFSVNAYNIDNPNLHSNYISFTFSLTREMSDVITWLTDYDLGTIYNGTASTEYVRAVAATELKYRLIGGSLPPNLTLSSEGEIMGCVSYQPSDKILYANDTTTFNFTVQAYSEIFPALISTKSFAITVTQEFTQPTDILYAKATPGIEDRLIIKSLLTNDSLIPTNYLYRPTDPNFGKASAVVYEHEYGIHASDVDEYLAAVNKNHYWRNITLGQLETAIAKNDRGEVIYEVVYSRVIDDLNNPQGESVSKSIVWPTSVDLGLGPWYTSVTDILASFVQINSQKFYTSLSPGYAKVLYPNSLQNMREQVANVLKQENDSKILPLWMTSQQEDGSTLGYVTAWVICYTKPYIVVNNQLKSYSEFASLGLDRTHYKSCAEIIKDNIETKWIDPVNRIPYRLNRIDFQLDRFSVNKSLTYNYNNNTTPPSWTGLPSATPVPDPLDSKDFYVLFPRKTILPDQTQY